MRRRSGRIGIPLASVALALIAPVAGAQELPLSAQDPTSGAAVRVEADGRVTDVVLLATWCRPCLDELETLTRTEARWNDLGYRLILVAVNARQDPERLARFARADTPPGRLLFDVDGAVQSALGASELPAHFVFDGTGALVERGHAIDRQLQDAIEALVRRSERR